MRWLKLVNRVSVNSSFFKQSKGATLKRTGTRSRFLPSMTISVLFLGLMGFTSFGFHAGQLKLMAAEFGRGEDFLQVFSIYLFLILSSALLLTLGTSDFKKTEWDLEWLVTLPLSKPLLMAIRVLERALSNPILILALFPPLVLVQLQQGVGPLIAVGWAITAAIPVLLLTATVQTILDTGVRLHWRPARIKNLQAITNLSGAALFYVISLSSAHVSRPLVLFKEHLGQVFLFTPLGLLVRGLYTEHKTPGFLLGYGIEVSVLICSAFFVLLALLRAGVVTGSGQTSVRKNTSFLSKPFYPFPFLSAFSLREFRMLARDQQYLAQTVVTPLLIFFLQIYFLYQSKGNLFTEPRTAAAIAFAMAGYSMMSSCYLCIVSEGPALWIFYTLPRTLRSLIFSKVARWGGVAAIYILFFFLWCATQSGRALNLELIIPFAIALAGVPLLVVVASALGILGFEGPSATPQRRMKPGSTYAYLAVLASFVACILIPTPGTAALSLLMMVLVASAFWQKASARLPYLLDPASVPIAKLSLADGLIAAQAFFLLQLFFTYSQVNRPAPLTGLIQFRSVFLAGLICWATLRYQFRKNLNQSWPYLRTSFVEKKKGTNPVKVFGCVLVGLCAADALILSSVWGRALWQAHAVNDALHPQDLRTIFLLVAIPLSAFFEESIFRGIIYRGLREKFRMPLALLSSAVLSSFLHPLSMTIPSLLLGASCCLLVEFTGSVGASVLLHSLMLFLEAGFSLSF